MFGKVTTASVLEPLCTRETLFLFRSPGCKQECEERQWLLEGRRWLGTGVLLASLLMNDAKNSHGHICMPGLVMFSAVFHSHVARDLKQLDITRTM